jgi:hypothetical protein
MDKYVRKKTRLDLAEPVVSGVACGSGTNKPERSENSKPVQIYASKSALLRVSCTKTRPQASVIQKKIRGLHPRTPMAGGGFGAPTRTHLPRPRLRGHKPGPPQDF